MLVDRRVKIVATIGPSTRSAENLEKALRAGMNVARLNFSHGTHAEHLEVISHIRSLSQKFQAPVTVLQDLQGPKIRVGKFKGGMIELKEGEIVTITMKAVEGGPGLIPSDFPELIDSVSVGTHILLDDGLLDLEVTEIGTDNLKAKVIFGGKLKDRKGMNVPNSRLRVDCLTPKDLEDLDFGLAQGVDWVALSFVRTANDIRKLRQIIDAKNPSTRICAKIEMLEALENIEEIVRLSDAVMVARGDLAVETGQTRLPGIQKKIIQICNRMNKPVITATQMLESMIENPRPTRAEITDVANAVLDGTDAVMLSAESASGKYPFKAIRTMHEIICDVEQNMDRYYKINLEQEHLTIPGAIGASAALSALKVDAQIIVCLTTSGKTANMISGYRPRARIIAVTDSLATLNRLELVWGIQCLPIQPYSTLEEVVSQVESLLIRYGLGKTGDRIVMTKGQPISEGAKTNTLYIFSLGGESIPKLSDSELPLRCASETLF